MSIERALACVVFTLWVSVCAFSPELIWQGFVLLRGHFGAAEAVSALFIGTLFAFFVEPVMERLKSGHWTQAQEPTGGLLVAALVSIAFGAAVVCIHEAVAAYLGGGHAGEEAKLAGLARALDEVREWSSIPAAVTAAWFAVGAWPRLALVAGGLACAWILAVGVLYYWGWQVVATTAVPCILIALLGVRLVRHRWDAGSFPALARLTATVAAAWLALAWLVEILAGHAGATGWGLYAPDAYYDDLRFYLGWSLGLAVAPNPNARAG